MSNIFDIFKKIESGQASSPSLPLSHLVVGLGNPGRAYEGTRHNTGFLCMDALSARCGASLDKAKFRALVGEATLSGVRCLLMKPQTLMNASGEAVAAASSFYHIPPEHILVISDDINLDVGAMRVRARGSDGGQKGIRSIIEHLGSDAFPRLRIGVGAKPHPDYDLAAWVLSEFTPAERQVLDGLFPTACEGIDMILRGDLDGAMRHCNGKAGK